MDTRIYPSSFDTVLVGLVGRSGAARPLCGAHDRPRRVVVEGVDQGQIMIARASAALEVPGNAQPGAAYLLFSGSGPHVIPIGPGQVLYAVGSAADLRCSVAVNDALVASYRPDKFAHELSRIRPTEFDTSNMQFGVKIPVAQKGERPKRVVLNAAVEGNIRVSRHMGAGPPFYTQPSSTGPHVYVLAPHQELYVELESQVGDGLPVTSVVSEIPWSAFIGPTGIPGPDGQE